MAVDGLQAVGVTNDDVFSVSASVVFHDANLSRESGANGVAYINLDVEALVLAAPTGTKVTGHHTTGCGHAEMA